LAWKDGKKEGKKEREEEETFNCYNKFKTVHLYHTFLLLLSSSIIQITYLYFIFKNIERKNNDE